MTHEEHRRVEELVDEASRLEPGRRADFLDEQCGENASLRQAVESRLAWTSDVGQWEDDPSSGDLAAGSQLGPYSILSQLGRGGMGVVYLARDATLDREVAVKVLPEELAHDAERLSRFMREAKTVAALVHPNIVTIHSIEQAGDVPFITMEAIQGRTLAEVLTKEGLPLDRFLDVAIPLADALDTAHRQGIVHRDLKPANVMLTDSGHLKVLDFGLAKLRRDVASRTAVTEPTLTREHAVIGTAPYMSPEQVEGRPVDGRSDLFSLGIVLHELATGKRPFRGASNAAVMAAILEKDPEPVHTTRTDLPHEVDQIVERCLRKDPAERYQTAAELHDDLRALQSGVFPLRRPVGRPGRRWLVAGVLAVLLGVILWQAFLKEEATTAREPGIAVLAFTTTGTDDAEIYATAITYGVYARLNSVTGLRVVLARNAYTGMSRRQIAEKLHADFVVTGVVALEGTKEDGRVLVALDVLRVED